MSVLNPYLWLGAIAVLAITNGITFWETWSWRDDEHHKALLIERAKAEDKVRKEEAALRAAALEIERNGVAEISAQVLRATKEVAEAKNALRKIPKCSVPVDVVSVLQPSVARVPASDNPPASAASGSPPVGSGAVPDAVDADALLEVCKRNYETVCIPNKMHVLGLQAYVRDVCHRR